MKSEYIDEVTSMEAMKEVERKLWLMHYDKLSEKLMEIVREKCVNRQMKEANQLGHEFCLLVSAQERVNPCLRRPTHELTGMMSWNIGTRKYLRRLST